MTCRVCGEEPHQEGSPAARSCWAMEFDTPAYWPFVFVEDERHHALRAYNAIMALRDRTKMTGYPHIKDVVNEVDGRLFQRDIPETYQAEIKKRPDNAGFGFLWEEEKIRRYLEEAKLPYGYDQILEMSAKLSDLPALRKLINGNLQEALASGCSIAKVDVEGLLVTWTLARPVVVKDVEGQSGE